MIKRLLKIALITTLISTFVVSVPLTYAEDDDEGSSSMPTIYQPDLLPGPSEETNQDDVQDYFLKEAIPTFTKGFIGLIAALSLLGLIVSGIRFVVAYGEEEGITAAKKTAVYSILGFTIAMFAYTIVSVINTLSFPDKAYDEAATDSGYTSEDQETIQYEDL